MMAQAQCIKYPIRHGYREKLVGWIERLEDRSTELLEVMAEAGLMAEAVFLERTDRGDFIQIYTRAKDLQVGTEVLSNSKQSLVQEFNQILTECVDVENAVTLALIYHTP